MAFKLLKKKDKEETDISVIVEAKEPFTWRGFWEETILDHYKAIKKILEDHGIMYFLTSPFQYRNRLILKLVVLFLGILIGVVPRSHTLIVEMRAANRASEFSKIKDQTFIDGPITWKPLTSKRYEKQHLLVFLVEGDTMEGVSSQTEDFDLTLKEANAGQLKGVSMRYKVVPLDLTRRLLLVKTDHTKQDGHPISYELTMKSKSSQAVLTIVLTNEQMTGDLFTAAGIDLSVISNLFESSESNEETIKNDESDLKDAIETYENNENRLKTIGETIQPTTASVKTLVDAQKILTTIKDNSTTKDVAELEKPELPESLTMPIRLTYTPEKKGSPPKTISTDEKLDEKAQKDVELDSSRAYREDLPSVDTAFKKVMDAVSKLNTDRMSKYDTLFELSDVLNHKIDDGGWKTGKVK